jgi:hypothetical protein
VHVILRAGAQRSARIDALSFVAFLVGVSTPLVWLFGGLPLALSALACAVVCLAMRRTRPVGAWALVGVGLGAAFIALLAVLLALSGPLFGDG